jgi:hypothetical protein
MRRWLPFLLMLASGCSVNARASPSAPPTSTPTTVSLPTPSDQPAAERTPLPSDFPVMPGATPVALPEDDPGLIGLWQTDRVGSAAYDFYASALPDAGYPIVGLYPGGDVALIRFTVAGGAIWQVVVHGSGEASAMIEVRLDRP